MATRLGATGLALVAATQPRQRGHSVTERALPDEMPPALRRDEAFVRLHRRFEIANERIGRLRAMGLPSRAIKKATKMLDEARVAVLTRAREIEQTINAGV